MGFLKSLNTVILVKGLNRVKFCPKRNILFDHGFIRVRSWCLRYSIRLVRSGLRWSPPQPIKQVSIGKIAGRETSVARKLIDKTLNENSAIAPKF